jgi:short-subunit dehydrogenase involved in D-alanine esterification of teichoic acids
VKVIEILPPAVQTELHDAKHQPDIKDGHLFGIPLDTFTDEAWKGLVEGKEDVPVGMSATGYSEGGFETLRRKIFGQMVERMKKAKA